MAEDAAAATDELLIECDAGEKTQLSQVDASAATRTASPN